jgi:hypothetical protein
MGVLSKIVLGAMVLGLTTVAVGAASEDLPAVLAKAINDKLPTVNFSPAFDANNFVSQIDNKWFPLKPGTTYVFTGIKDGGNARENFTVTSDHKSILGVSTTVIHDALYRDDQLVEETTDWYAQDKSGNVWYFGEQTRALDKGKWTTEGSWQAGVEGAKPGVYVQGTPKVGDAYFQEFYEGKAGDSAKVLSLDESITVPAGSYKNAQLTMEWSTEEPGAYDAKYYVPGVGVVKEFAATGATETLALSKVETK